MSKEKKVEERTVNGACRFCGQIRMITLPENEWLERIQKENKDGTVIADELATEECDCKQGADFRADHYVMTQCRENIETMFRKDHEEIAEIFQTAVAAVYYQNIVGVSVTTPERGVATMRRSGGDMKLKFIQKHETELTASY
ncbi:MAG: hypothetical protein IKE31_07030 [Eubacterium sp.]|nr:hypothetical protein [Eubacterium sp.]